MNLYVPVLIVVLSNTVYHICTKSVPQNVNTFAALSVTYAVGAIASAVIYLLTQKNPDLLGEFRGLNWSSFVLGLSIIGLEAGYILMYKVGWDVSVGQIVQSAFLAVALIVVGYLMFGEAITLRKILGIAVCLGGLYLIGA